MITLLESVQLWSNLTGNFNLAARAEGEAAGWL